MIESADQFISLRSSDDPEEYTRAANEEATLATWREIVDQHPDYRFWVAQNKTVPLDILELLAADESSKVRSMVASKRKLPPALQIKLAADPDETVRHSIVCNAKVCNEALELLANDDWEVVRDAARSKL